MTAVDWALALGVTFLAATIQGVVGLGFAMVSVPILALIDPALAPVPQLIITLPLTFSMAWRERTHLALRGVGWVIGGRVGGALIGIGLLAVASHETLDVAIAVLVMASATIIGSGHQVDKTSATQFGAGLFSGVSGLVASIGGPPLALLYSRDEGPVIRSNLAAVFVVGILITITGRILSNHMTWDDVRVAAFLFPALVAGYLISIVIGNRIRQTTMRAGILVLSVLGAIGLAARALFA
ncbi:MAG: sulfite exporter TauE/SafE family protein [Acidimicrobiia bacterium]